jgi:hypothetical protein
MRRPTAESECGSVVLHEECRCTEILRADAEAN